MNRIYQKPFPGAKNAGFTLIELLVVVLIIGILSAVALPQYQVAVAKARAVQLLVRLHALRTGMRVYYMANGSYPNNVTLLDVDLVSGAKRTGLTAISQDPEHVGVEWKDYSSCAVVSSGSIGCSLHNPHVYFSSSAQRDGVFCRGDTDFNIRLCRALGGQKTSPEGTYYLLP